MDKQTDKNDSRETDSLTPLNHLYHSPSPSAITLMAFSPNIDNQGLTDAFCAELTECGFNSAALNVTMSDITTTLNNCGKYGIYPIIGHSQLTLSETACKSFVDAIRNGQTVRHHYIVIVSHDVENYQSIGIIFKMQTPVSELTRIKSSDPLIEGGRGVQTADILRTLIPGGYLIYEFKMP